MKNLILNSLNKEQKKVATCVLNAYRTFSANDGNLKAVIHLSKRGHILHVEIFEIGHAALLADWFWATHVLTTYNRRKAVLVFFVNPANQQQNVSLMPIISNMACFQTEYYSDYEHSESDYVSYAVNYPLSSMKAVYDSIVSDFDGEDIPDVKRLKSQLAEIISTISLAVSNPRI